MFKFTFVTLLITVCHTGWTQVRNDKTTSGSHIFDSLFRRRSASDLRYTPLASTTNNVVAGNNRYSNAHKNENAFIRRIGSLTSANYLPIQQSYESVDGFDRYPAANKGFTFDSFDKTGGYSQGSGKPVFYQLPIQRRYSFEYVQMNTTAKPYEMKSIDIEAAELPPLVLSLAELPTAQWGVYPQQQSAAVPVVHQTKDINIDNYNFNSNNKTDVIPIKSYFDI